MSTESPSAASAPEPQAQPSDTTQSKTAIVFIDGQNLFHTAQEAFGYSEPNYHPVQLAQHVCRANSWSLKKVYFYTGVPRLQESEFWHKYWSAKLRGLRRDALVHVFQRDTIFRAKIMTFDDTGDARSSGSRYRLPDGGSLPSGTKLLFPNGKTGPGEFTFNEGGRKGR